MPDADYRGSAGNDGRTRDWLAMVMSLRGGDVIRVVTHTSSCEAHIRGSPISAVERSSVFLRTGWSRPTCIIRVNMQRR
jgi:hypothetical protein